MKKTLIVIFLLSTIAGFSQQPRLLNYPKQSAKKLHYGFTLGINTMDFTIHRVDNFASLDSIYSVDSKRNMGFTVGLLADYKLLKYLNLRFTPALEFGQRDLKYIVLDKMDGADRYFKEKNMKISSTIVAIPIYLKYSTHRYNNYNLYVAAGLAYRYDVDANKKIKESDKPKIKLKTGDFCYELALGADFYLEYFRLSTEVKLSIGTANIMENDNTQYTKSINKLNSKMVSLLFHFE